MRLWRWIQQERLWRRRQRLFVDFMRRQHGGRTFDDSWFPRRDGAETVLGSQTMCDFGLGGVAWHCIPGHGHPFELTDPLDGAMERLEADLAETSVQVLCDGVASFRTGFTYPELELVVCGSHEAWLRRHCLLHGLDSGVIEAAEMIVAERVSYA